MERIFGLPAQSLGRQRLTPDMIRLQQLQLFQVTDFKISSGFGIDIQGNSPRAGRRVINCLRN
ncbi:hypothetical protein D3C81_2310220 [compost metagenome]